MHVPWDQFLARYGALARNLAARLSGRPQEAEDVVQEAAMALLVAMKKGRELESVEHARNYFLRSVHNLALKRRRLREAAPLAAEPETPMLNGVDVAAIREQRRRLADAVTSLDDHERDLVVRRFVECQPLRRVADETGVPLSTLHGHEKALLDRLRRGIEAAGDGAP